MAVQTPPVSYRTVLRDREFAALFTAETLSVVGDQMARLAVALLVFAQTSSPLAAAATYASSYLAWLLVGPVLAAVADRLPRRAVMVSCDVVRAALVAALVVPGLPVAVVFAVLIVVGLLAPLFDAARSSLLADVLEGERYAVGNALIGTFAQAGQLSGFLLGGLLVAGLGTRGTLLVDALTFVASAVLCRIRLVERESDAEAAREDFGAELAAGTRLVLGRRDLRTLLGWGLLVSAVTIPPEGLAVPVARAAGGGSLAAGVLTAAVPAGFVIGSWLLLRLPQARRRALFPTLVLLSCAALALTALLHTLALIAVAWFVAGTGTALQTVANSAFVQAVPRELRARAFGVAATALMTVQGAVLLAAGGLADVVGAREAVTVVAGVAAAVLAAAVIPGLKQPALPVEPVRNE